MVQDGQVRPLPRRKPAPIDRPSCAAGDVAHIRAAATSDAPMWLTSRLSAPSIVSVLPASVPSSRKAASRPTVMVWLPSGTFVPTGNPAPPVPSVIAIVRSGPRAAMIVRATTWCTW